MIRCFFVDDNDEPAYILCFLKWGQFLGLNRVQESFEYGVKSTLKLTYEHLLLRKVFRRLYRVGLIQKVFKSKIAPHVIVYNLLINASHRLVPLND
jgi:hypothetical protein